jgi:hypothetical protein
MDKYFYQTQFAAKMGIDLKSNLIENGITWHMNVGGVHLFHEIGHPVTAPR